MQTGKSAPEKVKNRQNRSKIVEKQKNAARQIRRFKQPLQIAVRNTNTSSCPQ
jgi:hypothetical protein